MLLYMLLERQKRIRVHANPNEIYDKHISLGLPLKVQAENLKKRYYVLKSSIRGLI